MSQVFDEMDALDIDACSAFVSGLSRNGFVDEARVVFMQFRQRDRLELVYWTSVIAACSQNGKDMEALDLFRDMLHPHMIHPPPSIDCNIMLPVCSLLRENNLSDALYAHVVALSFSTLGFVISVSRRSCCKIVVDGAWKAGRCQGIAAWCALTEEFGLDRKGTSLVSASSATMVEGIAALQALIRWASSKNCRRVHILTDASEVASGINDLMLAMFCRMCF
ncbi:hypothetical protein RHMOL_Rhmol07G0019000 [Rhododendron molle]|uniref:Uncharacterized protein n=1 Tax=Rhododendron molle TaxID=49168 RepID=A0ACC0MVR5_RHOML|nr:hypothetical protein RHMOL_Rhmol07G0019000 [Rhododendron molle]